MSNARVTEALNLINAVRHRLEIYDPAQADELHEVVPPLLSAQAEEIERLRDALERIRDGIFESPSYVEGYVFLEEAQDIAAAALSPSPPTPSEEEKQ